MNISLIYRNSIRYATTLAILVLLLSLAIPLTSVFAAPLKALAIDGDGALTVSPISVAYGSATTFSFTFTADTGDFASGSQVVINIPAGWTPPSGSGIGRVLVASTNCTLRSPGAELAGFTSSSISIDIGCAQGETFTVTYASAKPGNLAGAPYTFLTTTEVPTGIAPAEIAVSPTVAVTPKTLTVAAAGLTPNNKVYNGDTAATLVTGSPTLVGVVGTDIVSINTTGATGNFDNRNAGTGKTVTITGLALAGADAGNYTLTDPTRLANITALPITITAVTTTKVYDGNATSSGLPTLSLATPLIAGDLEPVWTQSYNNKNAATGKALTPAGVVNDGNSGLNYSYNFVSNNTGEIAKLPITITAAADTKTYNGTSASSGHPTLSAGTPLVVGDIEPIWTQTFDNKNVGTGKILTPAGLVSDGNNGANYSYNFVSDSTGEITIKAITVTAAAKSKAFGAVDPMLTYNVSPALFSGDTFSGALARAAGEIPGVYAITQNTLSAGSNYTITYIGSSLTINPKIYGSVGVAGVTLSYNDGSPKTVLSGSGGVYSLVVPYGWSGVVTPSKTAYTFNPTHIDYSNVTSNKAAQHYTAITERSKNGGFNIYVGISRAPQYWIPANFTTSDGKDTIIKKEGAASVKMTGTPGKTKTLTQTLALSGLAGNKFTFSFWARGVAVPVAGICRGQVLLYNGAILKATYTVNCATGSYGFQKFTLSFTAPVAYTSVIIKFSDTKASGNIWFDAISLLK